MRSVAPGGEHVSDRRVDAGSRLFQWIIISIWVLCSSLRQTLLVTGCGASHSRFDWYESRCQHVSNRSGRPRHNPFDTPSQADEAQRERAA
jgi:hypothetical protein